MPFKLRRAEDIRHVSDIKNACYQPDDLSFIPCTYIMGKESCLLSTGVFFFSTCTESHMHIHRLGNSLKRYPILATGYLH